MLLASALACRRLAAGGGGLRRAASSAAAAAGAAPADGLPKKYSNLDELEADAKPLLTPQVG